MISRVTAAPHKNNLYFKIYKKVILNFFKKNKYFTVFFIKEMQREQEPFSK